MLITFWWLEAEKKVHHFWKLYASALHICSYSGYSSYQLGGIDKCVSVGEALKCQIDKCVSVGEALKCLMQNDIDTFYCDKTFIWQKKAHI